MVSVQFQTAEARGLVQLEALHAGVLCPNGIDFGVAGEVDILHIVDIGVGNIQCRQLLVLGNIQMFDLRVGHAERTQLRVLGNVHLRNWRALNLQVAQVRLVGYIDGFNRRTLQENLKHVSCVGEVQFFNRCGFVHYRIQCNRVLVFLSAVVECRQRMVLGQIQRMNAGSGYSEVGQIRVLRGIQLFDALVAGEVHFIQFRILGDIQGGNLSVLQIQSEQIRVLGHIDFADVGGVEVQSSQFRVFGHIHFAQICNEGVELFQVRIPGYIQRIDFGVGDVQILQLRVLGHVDRSEQIVHVVVVIGYVAHGSVQILQFRVLGDIDAGNSGAADIDLGQSRQQLDALNAFHGIVIGQVHGLRSSDFLRGQSVVLVGIEMLCYVIPECFVRKILCINLYVGLCRFRSVNIHDGTPGHQ